MALWCHAHTPFHTVKLKYSFTILEDERQGSGLRAVIICFMEVVVDLISCFYVQRYQNRYFLKKLLILLYGPLNQSKSNAHIWCLKVPPLPVNTKTDRIDLTILKPLGGGGKNKFIEELLHQALFSPRPALPKLLKQLSNQKINSAAGILNHKFNVPLWNLCLYPTISSQCCLSTGTGIWLPYLHKYIFFLSPENLLSLS